jgi:hypothetical protein
MLFKGECGKFRSKFDTCLVLLVNNFWILIYVCLSEWIDGWMDEWMDEWMNKSLV